MEETRILQYNLQFFADGEGGEKTEPATAKKLRDARKKGQVAKSREIVMAAQLIAAFILLRIYVQTMGTRFLGYFNFIYSNTIPDFISMHRDGPTAQAVWSLLSNIYLQILLTILPFLLVAFVVGIFGNALQFKFKITTEPMKPKFSKLNPKNGFKRMFSKQALFELAKAIVKIVVIFLVAYITLREDADDIFILLDMTLLQAVTYVGTLVLDVGLRISIVYMLVAIVDLIYQKWKFKEDMKMTKQEVKDEYKNAEGDPHIKGQQKARMRQASQRRIMQAVQQADVVITNPEHLAVAIKYEAGTVAPMVVAKGEDYMAQRMKEIAREHDVPIYENKPLARTLHATVEVGEPVPPETYEVVAEILVAVMGEDKLAAQLGNR